MRMTLNATTAADEQFYIYFAAASILYFPSKTSKLEHCSKRFTSQPREYPIIRAAPCVRSEKFSSCQRLHQRRRSINFATQPNWMVPQPIRETNCSC